MPLPAPVPAAVEPPPEAMPLTAFAALYLRAHRGRLAPHTLATVEREYRIRVHPVLGALPLEDVSRERVELWLAEVIESSSSRRIAVGALAALRVILSAALRWGRIPVNPAMGLSVPADEDTSRYRSERVLSEDQLRILFSAVPHVRLETMLRAAAEGALRKGEVIGLQWPDVELADRRLHVRRSVWHGPGEDGRPAWGTKSTKGRSSRRVAISAGYAAALAAWYEASVVEGGADAAGFVWPGRRAGRPMNSHTPSQALTRLLVTAGLVDAAGKPLTTFHGLRHAAASVMLIRGVPLIAVSRMLGHSSPVVTGDVYSHLFDPGALDVAAAAFDGLHEPAARCGGTVRGEVAEPRTA